MPLRILFLLLFTAWLPQAVSAQPNTGVEQYRVRAGDSLELLAAEYYGNRVHKIYIMVENGLDHDRPLKTGEKLRIPVSQTITTSKGDSLEGLAKAYLGAGSRAKYLADFNGLEKGTTLAVGQEITVPMRVRYRAKASQSLRDISLSLFASPQQVGLLRDYNSLKDDLVAAGQTISVPVPKIEIQASKRRPPDAQSNARAEKRRASVRQAKNALPEAQRAWRDGDFASVKRELTQLELDYLDTELAADVGILLGAVYVAFDDEDSALATFAKVLRRSPALQIDAARHSPKIRLVWDRAKEQQR